MMRTMLASTGILSLILAAPVTGQDHLTSPYRPQLTSELRGLSAEEVTALRDGTGMGLARAAELNSYPGPRPLLDAVRGNRFQATAEQVRQTTAIFDRMKHAAQQIGWRILAEETRLEAAFIAGTITESELRSRVDRIAGLQGELRTIHLAAHLATRALLTDEQVHQYNQLRGYTTNEDQGHQHHH